MKRLRLFTAARGMWNVLEPLAQQHRREPTAAEDALWQRLRRGALGARFRRQHAIQTDIVDFFSLPAMLVVEVDGPIHADQQEEDALRDAVLTSLGYTVLRFTNEEVLGDVDTVLAEISNHVRKAREPVQKVNPIGKKQGPATKTPPALGEGSARSAEGEAATRAARAF